MPTIVNSLADELLIAVCEKLQIADSQQEQAEARYSAIGTVLERPFEQYFPSIYPQGSLRLGTTVRPKGQQEFDLDIVSEFLIDPSRLPDPTVLIDGMFGVLKRNPTYRGMVTRKNRCVRVTYANDFHLDILPACPDPRGSSGHLLVPDCGVRGWKASNPKGYADWFESRCQLIAKVFGRTESIPPKESVSEKPILKLATQLLKRWRDIAYAAHNGLAPISIVLTTLAGRNYGGQVSLSQGLMDIVDGIVLSIPPGSERLVVLNPANEKEDLSEKWDADRSAYENFVRGMHLLRDQVQRLLAERTLSALGDDMKSLFGEDVTTAVFKEHAQRLEKQRQSGNLYATRRSGVLSTVSASAVPVAKHTFYGE